MLSRDFSDAFSGTKRSEFFQNSGFPFWDATYEGMSKKKTSYPYAVFSCLKQSRKRIQNIQEASVLVAEVFDRVLEDIKKWSSEEIVKWGFDPRFSDLLNLEWDKHFCLRVGWALEGEVLKVMEINSQTPSFWFESEFGNRIVSERFGLKNPTFGSDKMLKEALNQAIEKGLTSLPEIHNLQPKVGFVTSNWYEDLAIMKWLASNCDYDFEIVVMEDLDFTKNKNIAFNRKTGNMLDALIFWYPLEWLVKDKFGNGEDVWPIFVEAVKAKSVALVHTIPSFFIQPKSILAYITQNQQKIFVGKLRKAKKYFLKTYFEPVLKNYIAKPIWGREGRGSYIVDGGKMTYSRYQEDYYVKQKKVYQEFMHLPQLKMGDKKITVIYEAWVYRVWGKLVPGGIGMRGSEHLITDDYSYWLPIGA